MTRKFFSKESELYLQVQIFCDQPHSPLHCGSTWRCVFYLILIIKCNYLLNLKSGELWKICRTCKPSPKTMFKVLEKTQEESHHFSFILCCNLSLLFQLETKLQKKMTTSKTAEIRSADPGQSLKSSNTLFQATDPFELTFMLKSICHPWETWRLFFLWLKGTREPIQVVCTSLDFV